MMLPRRFSLPFLALGLTGSLALAADPPQMETGDRIPDVSVTTADGAELALREAVKSEPAVMIFYRGGWCPFCTRHLMALADIREEIEDAGLRILAISPDQPAKLAETPDHDELGYTLLSDSDVAAAKAFGIAFQVDDETLTRYRTKFDIDLEAASGKSHHMLPHPAVFVVDREGVIRFAHIDPDYKTRLAPEKILAAARAIRTEFAE